MAIFIMLDVGGTEIKGGVFDAFGSLLSGIRKFPAKAGEDPDTIFEKMCIRDRSITVRRSFTLKWRSAALFT